jgi:lipopolysaccharide transport system ATP-binding protein
MALAIRVQNLSKVYRLGELNRGLFLHDWVRKLRGQTEEVDRADPKVFWALRDVSFDVEEGDVVGLLGRNGAGKSTLLKLISQITAPTDGVIKLRGRAASLLEVGTGFHHELTGRDNIFINGAILGMTRREIASKLDEIIDFSGIENFIDTPVKRYSVGMRVRLAFAIAAQLETEILILDEVLAVGDAAFQQKCLGRIGNISRSGRTVLFVSHDVASIEALCTRGLVLNHGRVVFDGSQSDAIEHYASLRAAGAKSLDARTDRVGSGQVRVSAIELRDPSGLPMASARSGKPLEVVLQFKRQPDSAFPPLGVELTVSTNLGAPVFFYSSWLEGIDFENVPESGEFVCRFEELPLPPGHYHIGYQLTAGSFRKKEAIDAIPDATELNVEPGDFYGTGKLPPPKTGVCLVRGAWRMECCRMREPSSNDGTSTTRTL